MTDDKVVPLQKHAPIPGDLDPHPYVIESLEELLADAKSGKIRHIAGIAWSRNGGYVTFSVGEHTNLAVMGGCDVLKMRVFNESQIPHDR